MQNNMTHQRSSIDFSIIIPSFRDKRILETLQTINCQDYPREKIEVLIMDGGSDQLLLNEMRQQLHAHDVLVSEADRGIFDAINKGIKRASGQVVFTIGSDDKFSCTSAVTSFMRAFTESEVDYVCAGVAMTNQDWKPIRDWPATLPTFKNFLLGRQIHHFGFACKQIAYQQNGFFDAKYDVSADFDFFVRLSKLKMKGKRLPKRLVLLRLGGNSSKNARNVCRGNLQVLRSGFAHYGLFIMVHFLLKPFTKVFQFLRAWKNGRAPKLDMHNNANAWKG
jgi:glycosyltransferase